MLLIKETRWLSLCFNIIIMIGRLDRIKWLSPDSATSLSTLWTNQHETCTECGRWWLSASKTFTLHHFAKRVTAPVDIKIIVTGRSPDRNNPPPEMYECPPTGLRTSGCYQGYCREVTASGGVSDSPIGNQILTIFNLKVRGKYLRRSALYPGESPARWGISVSGKLSRIPAGR